MPPRNNQQGHISDRFLMYNDHLNTTESKQTRQLKWNTTGVTGVSAFFVPKDIEQQLNEMEAPAQETPAAVAEAPPAAEAKEGDGAIQAAPTEADKPRVRRSHHVCERHTGDGAKDQPRRRRHRRKEGDPRNVTKDEGIDLTKVIAAPLSFTTTYRRTFLGSWGAKPKTQTTEWNACSNPNNVPYGVFPYYEATPASTQRADFTDVKLGTPFARYLNAPPGTQVEFSGILPASANKKWWEASSSVGVEDSVSKVVKAAKQENVRPPSPRSPRDLPPGFHPTTYAGMKAIRALATHAQQQQQQQQSVAKAAARESGGDKPTTKSSPAPPPSQLTSIEPPLPAPVETKTENAPSQPPAASSELDQSSSKPGRVRRLAVPRSSNPHSHTAPGTLAETTKMVRLQGNLMKFGGMNLRFPH